MDREKFLDRISGAQKRAGRKIPSAEFSEEDVVSKPAIVGTPLEAFKRNFKANRGTLFESIDDLIKFLRAQGYKRGVIDAKAGAELPELAEEFEMLKSFDRANPDEAQFGVSRASMGIAESGALVLKDCDTADRLTSIAPWMHIALLDKTDIVQTIPEALAKTLTDTPYAIYVCSPSKTADVEGILIEGVHGPGIQACLLI